MAEMSREKAAEDLNTIKTIMESCAQQQRSEGIYFKIWGLLIPIATAINYLLTHVYNLYFLIAPFWGITLLTGFILTILTVRRRKQNNSRSMGAKLQRAIWLSCWFSMAILFTAGSFSKVLELNTSMMVLAILMGNSVFISGTLSGSRLLKLVAVGWWLSGVVVSLLVGVSSAIVIGITTLFLNFIPGVILDRQFRRDCK